MTARVLVAGIGNIFFGDDGFGSEVARRLGERALPDGVHAVDFGIRGLDLAFALTDGYDAAVLVDAVARGGAPGTLYVIEPAEPGGAPTVETHAMTPTKVLELVRALGGGALPLRLLGCEPACLGDEANPVMGLSPEVAAAVTPALDMIEELVARLQREVGGDA